MTASGLQWLEDRIDQVDGLSVLRALSELNAYRLEGPQLLVQALGLWIDHLGVDVVSVQFLEDRLWREALTLAWSPEHQQVEIPLKKTPFWKCFRKLSAEMVQAQSVVRRTPLSAGGQPGGAALVLPLGGDQGLLGAIFLYHARAEFFTPAHERLGLIFANFLAQAIVANRLVRHMHEEVDQRVAAMDALMQETLELKKKYEQLSFVDELTQLYNRRFFFQEAKLALARDTRNDAPFSLIMLDVDHFKRINDRYGHSTGDEVLRCISDFLRASVRETDILSRFGGEEFALALPGTDCIGARRVAQVLLDGVRRLPCRTGKGELVRITISLGLACRTSLEYLNGETDLERLLHNADLALYAAKEGGRDQCCAYEEMTHCPL